MRIFECRRFFASCLVQLKRSPGHDESGAAPTCRMKNWFSLFAKQLAFSYDNGFRGYDETRTPSGVRPFAG